MLTTVQAFHRETRKATEADGAVVGGKVETLIKYHEGRLLVVDMSIEFKGHIVLTQEKRFETSQDLFQTSDPNLSEQVLTPSILEAISQIRDEWGEQTCFAFVDGNFLAYLPGTVLHITPMTQANSGHEAHVRYLIESLLFAQNCINKLPSAPILKVAK